jgi:hypothetical protein
MSRNGRFHVVRTKKQLAALVSGARQEIVDVLSQMGTVSVAELGPTHEIFSDDKKIDGVLVPMKQVVKVRSNDGSSAIPQVLIFESVTFNDVDAEVFTPPQAVRDLLRKGKPAATP